MGHVPRNISSVCSVFLLRGGVIECKVTGPKRYSVDLPQGGLELPCILTFIGSCEKISKIKKILQTKPKAENSLPAVQSTAEPPAKKIKVEPDSASASDSASATIWVSRLGCRLSLGDKLDIMNGEMLNDNYAYTFQSG